MPRCLGRLKHGKERHLPSCHNIHKLNQVELPKKMFTTGLQRQNVTIKPLI